jgi:excisionase family DNA binding protein
MENTYETPSILVNQEEACRLLGGIDRVTLWRLVKAGELPQVKIGRRSFIARVDLDQYVATHRD